MTSSTGDPRRRGRPREHGQMIVIFTLCLLAIMAMAGLLIDGGMAWSHRRQAQAAADTAALAAAKAVVSGSSADAVRLAAKTVANQNGFGNVTTDCSGVTLPGNAGPGVQVNHPPLSGAHTVANDPVGANSFVEVITSRKMTTTFSGAVGVPCWMVSARAVSSIGTKSVASCSFCSLNESYGNHTLVLKNGATLRVDGDIYVNSKDGLTGDDKNVSFDGNTCVPGQEDGKVKGDFFVCGDGFDIFGTGGTISARTISAVGGWETHDFNIAWADALAKKNGAPCPLHTQPLGYSTPVANVCIGMPSIADPLNDGATPTNIIPVPPVVGKPVAGVDGCPSSGVTIPTGTSALPALLTIQGSVVTKICPGTYFGGLSIKGSAIVTMMPGVYYMAGGGFTIANAAAVDGTAGVMIYNASGTASVEDTNPGVDLVPAKSKTKKDPVIAKGGGLTASPNKNITVDQSVVLTFEIEKNKAALPTGTMTFYDGQDPISGACTNMAVGAGSNGNAVKATCTTSWPAFGTKSISAVYSGDATYNAIGDTLTITIPPPAGAPIAPISITGTGNVKLYGETSGVYKGLTIFQDRTSALTITLQPGAGGPACNPDGSWLTIDVPDNPNVDTPDACGPLGGLRGTIYAANQDALVYITASGLSNLQVIAGKIQIDSDANARFAYTPEYFANGSIRLVE